MNYEKLTQVRVLRGLRFNKNESFKENFNREVKMRQFENFEKFKEINLNELLCLREGVNGGIRT